MLKPFTKFSTYVLCVLLFGNILASDEFEVTQIQFIGATSFTEDELFDIIYSEDGDDFDSRLVKLDKIVLMNFYRQNGFLTVEVNDSLILNNKLKEVQIYYLIEESQRYYLGRFVFEGNKTIDAVHFFNVFKDYNQGEPFDESKIEAGRNVIEGYYYNMGKPYIDIKLDYHFEQDSMVVVLFYIKENQTVYIKDIKYIGQKLVQKFIIRRELEFKSGDIYNREKLDQSQQNIYGTGLFDYVRFELEAIPGDTSQANLKILVRERDPRWIGLKVGLGYEQEESYGNKLDFTAEGGHRNLFGTARSISLHVIPSFLYDVKSKSIVNPENQISFVFVEPWIGYTRTPGVFQISYNQYRPLNSADFNVSKASFNVSHKFKGGYETSGGIEAKFVNQLTSGIIDSVLEKDAGKDEVYSVSLFGSKDTRKNYFNPRDGSVVDIGLSFSSSHGSSSSGESENVQYFTFITSWKRYQPIPIKFISKNTEFTFASRLKLGTIYELGSGGEIPISDLFFAGGATTVRGFDEQLLGPVSISRNNKAVALGGKMLFLANAELRFPIYWLFVGEIFLDGGNVWSEIDELRSNDLRFGTGAGIALITPIGPIRLDYGIKLKPKKYEDTSTFHVGFYFAF